MSLLNQTEQAAAPSTPASNEVLSYFHSSTPARYRWLDDTGIVIDPFLTNASVASVAAAYAADTYLAGSAITIPTTGGWRAGYQYTCVFDMTKTGAGTATPIATIRMGTAGTTSDTSIATITWAAGTGVIDTGLVQVNITFRTVGSGTTAVLQCMGQITHHLAATGLTTTGASGIGIILATSSGFNSTTSNTIGISFNGGASFSGTNTLVQTKLTVL